MEANTNHHSNIDPKFITTSFPKEYSVGDISSTLKEADLVASLTELSPLRSKCREMLGYFIAAFERDQNVGFNSVCVSRELVMERYLWHPPPPVDLKYEALNSFLEMQMMMEATQFVENKLRSLSGEPTFRSLLWPQKPLAKSVENQGSHFQSVTPESANCTQYQPVNWSTIRAVPSQAIQVPMQPHKGMPKPWTIPSIPPSPCTETWAKEMCEKQNLQWRAPAPVVPNRFKATILRARLEARARLHTSQHVTVPHAQLKVAGVGGRGESRPTTPALAHPSWSPRCKHPWNSVWAESEPATGVLPHSGQYQNPQNQWDPALFPSQQSPLQPSTSLPQQGNSTQQPLHPHRAFMTTTKPPPFVYKPKALSYPFFLWNGHTYATANPAIVNTPHLSGTSLHQYPKMPRARFCLSDIAQHQPNQ
ncbi:hypothetical protein JZ751_011727 [Albula glossodonta]|uniref:Testis expressed sequence 15 domain-containing protein n=1 Tax=Albula glossodonta TaxID=121402 RepID=A0A8T2PQI4_9TELE|nr:hypothetical protein JZ751_011727 [Albula glossodonta]